jgi:hypothetical protein
MYLRTVKVPSSSGKINEYVRIVEAYREDGKVKQRVIADLGRKDVLAALLPKLQRLLAGENAIMGQESQAEVKVLEAATWGPMLVVRHLAQQLGLPAMFQRLLQSVRVADEEDEASAAPPAERALVLIANRLIRPGSEHALASWLESDWVCDTAGRRFVPRWHPGQGPHLRGGTGLAAGAFAGETAEGGGGGEPLGTRGHAGGADNPVCAVRGGRPEALRGDGRQRPGAAGAGGAGLE